MAFNGSGLFQRIYSWVTDRNNGVKIEADRMDAEMDGMADALSLCILKDGQQTPTANLPMGGFKLTNLGDATNATDALNRQTGDGRYHPIGATTTTDNAIARYDGTAGALQDSGVTIDDSNNVVTPASLIARSADAGASDYSGVVVDRNSASPAANDVIGSLVFRGRDDGGNETDYGSIRGIISDKTDASEDGQIAVRTIVAGMQTIAATIGPGVQLGSPTNGDKGAGTLNATGLYVNDDAAVTLAAAQTLTNKVLTAPDINGGTADALTSLGVRSTGAAFDMKVANAEVLTADRTLTVDLDDASRILRLQTDVNVSSAGAALIDDADTTAQKATLGLENTSTDMAVVRFDGTTGNTDNSLVTISDIGEVGGVTALQVIDPSTTQKISAVCTDSGASTFTALNINRVSTTPANNDFLGKITFNGRDNGNNVTTFAEIDSQIVDVVDGSEDGRLILRTMVAGSQVDSIIANGNVSLKGTATNDSASSGYVGEYVSSVVLTGSGVSLTTSTDTNVTSISLGAGDWDVWGSAAFDNTGATDWTRLTGAVSRTSATIPSATDNTQGLANVVKAAGTSGTADPTFAIPVSRMSLASTTTVYLVANAVFSASTCAAYGFIAARRVR